jgi:hypothetical protein
VTNSGFDEGAAIANQWTDTIYKNDFKSGAGKFFNIVMDDDGSQSIEYSPPHPSKNKIKLTVTFIKGAGDLESGDIREITIKQFKQFSSKGIIRWEEQSFGPNNPIRFTHFTFEKLLGFLKLLTELDLVNLNQRRIALSVSSVGHLDDETKTKMRELLKQPDGKSLVEELLRNGSITSNDLVNIGYRKHQLTIFRRLLKRNDFEFYRVEHGIASAQHEKILQHFLKLNAWIFGFGLDYRYLSILQDEAAITHEDVARHDGAVGDFLLGATNFTVLVELKLPTTKLFQNTRSRAGSWRLSTELLEAVSQILEQKAGWQVKSDSVEIGFDSSGKRISQRTADPKCILIIGSETEFAGSDKENCIKLKTFELFRRDSRNIEILTFDELYARAHFIVNQANENDAPNILVEEDEVPF